MAYSSFFFFLLLSASLVLCLVSAAVPGQKEIAAWKHSHAIKLTSLLPSSLCTPTKVAKSRGKTSLRLVDKYGPCSQLVQQRKGKIKSSNQKEILRQDQSRVKAIQTKFLRSWAKSKKTQSTTLPAQHGSVVGSGNYIVRVGLGTPQKQLSLMFDTGSDLTWTQCKPCLNYCYKQQVDPIFDPTASTSYTNVSCTSSLCSSLYTATYNAPGCYGSNSTCVYAIQYGDSSFSTGFFAKDTVTLTSTAVFTNFSFGCGQNNQGLYGGAAGVLGLARHPISFPSQTVSKYKQLFSYCLPSSASYTGHLTFGGTGAASAAIKYTPFSSKTTSFYGIDVTGISVSGVKLAINGSVFSSGAGMIDSGTVITRLPPTAYSALKTEFRRQMAQYKSARPLLSLDTCYDLSAHTTVNIPKVTISFNGGIDVPISAEGTLYVASPSQVCLAFMATGADTDVLIFGNNQQKTLEVVYDVPRRRLGFASAGCN